MPGSKLLAACQQVEAKIRQLIDAAKEQLKYRVQLSTLMEKIIPKAMRDGVVNGATLAQWQATEADLRTKMGNAAAWCDRFCDELRAMLDALEVQVRDYKPMQKKKQTLRDPVMSDDMVAARTKKKRDAIALIDRGRSLMKDVQDTLSVAA